MIEPSVREEALEPVIESFLARFRAGERPGVEEYANRHPGLADLLRQILPALVAVECDLTLERGPEAEPGPPASARRAWATIESSARSAGAAWAWSTRPSSSRSAGMWP